MSTSPHTTYATNVNHAAAVRAESRNLWARQGFVLLAATAFLVGCGNSESKSQVNTVTQLPAGDATRGASQFTSNCSSCHGASAAGSTGPNIRNKSSALVQSTVRNGKGTMPALSTSALPDQALADIIAYLNSF